tara:strand:- start:2104 stop:2664 length:561 start_codon:yes stop_codon:yes gene_type:complete
MATSPPKPTIPTSQYFAQFPKVQFDMLKNGKYKSVPDLTSTAKFRSDALDLVRQYQPYRIPDGERPDITSHKLYDDVRYIWVILFVNNIKNIYTDWPKSDTIMTERMYRKYGSPAAAQALIHHYEDDRGNEIDRPKYIENTEKNKIVTEFDYEISQNEDKRDIIVPQPAYLQPLLNELQTVFNSPV